jgi:hypothetical protein
MGIFGGEILMFMRGHSTGSKKLIAVLVLYYFCGDVRTVGEFLILDFKACNLKMLLYGTNCSLTAHINGIMFRNVCCNVSETGDSTDISTASVYKEQIIHLQETVKLNYIFAYVHISYDFLT